MSPFTQTLRNGNLIFGKSLSVFIYQNRIADGSSGQVACDHYHRWEADLDLMADLGVNAYRFSISWPRVQPDGQGPWNEAGFEFYERIFQALAERGIQAHLTLNHWDLPQALQEQGGWHARATCGHFVKYALEVARRFGQRCASICTHNEPWVMAVLGPIAVTIAWRELTAKKESPR